jgi:hypothetical protein
MQLNKVKFLTFKRFKNIFQTLNNMFTIVGKSVILHKYGVTYDLKNSDFNEI